MRSLIFDMDGVLLDWHSGFERHMAAAGRPPRCPQAYRADYDNIHDSFGFDRATFCEHVRGYHRTEAFKRVPEMPGARRAITEIRRRVPVSLPFYAVTAVDDEPAVRAARLQHLSGLPIDELRLVGLTGSKEAHFRELGPAIVFEDSPGKAAEAIRAGCIVVLIDWPHNRAADCHYRISDWAEAPDLVSRILAQAGA